MATEELLVSVHLPADILKQLIAYQTEAGIESASGAVVNVLRQFFQLNTTTSSTVSMERFEALANRVEHLTHQIEILKQAIALPPRTLTSVASNRPGLATSVLLLSDEDIEDEPDEILYDFLEPGH
jgi:hypothetical protein